VSKRVTAIGSRGRDAETLDRASATAIVAPLSTRGALPRRAARGGHGPSRASNQLSTMTNDRRDEPRDWPGVRVRVCARCGAAVRVLFFVPVATPAGRTKVALCLDCEELLADDPLAVAELASRLQAP
jgi:hypothetical protein